MCTQPGQLEWVRVEDRPLATGEIRVRSRFSAAKHGTEMAAYKGYANPRGAWDRSLRVFTGRAAENAYPTPVGNMFVGPVTEVGPGVEGLCEGDQVFGHGGFADVHTISADRCRKMPTGLDWRSAVCIDPAEFALGAVRDGQVRIGDVVAVFGLGAIGLMVVQLARIAGAALVVGVDPLLRRRQAAEALGAGAALDPTEAPAGDVIKKTIAGSGADICIDFSGHRDALQQALKAVALGGTVVYGAFPPAFDAGLDFGAEAHLNRPNLVFSRANSDPNRDHPRWDNRRIVQTCFELLSAGRLSGEQIVEPVVPFDELLEHYPKIASDPASSIKLGAMHQ
jgi:threonine dehydrogenase-like Zn-dependent dehydrogenase